MHLASCVLVGLFLNVSAPRMGVTFPEEVAYRKGSYALSGQRIRFFAFSYRGELATAEVQRRAAAVIQDIMKQDVSAVQNIVPSSGHPPQRALRLEKGQVLVLGWVNGSRGHTGWLAADTDGQPRPKHRWLTSTGDSGVLDSSKAWLDPERSGTRQCWRLTRSRSDYVILQIDATLGRLEWFLDWQER
jgi:hypothetical protein